MQIVTGYGEAGNALVTGGVDKVIFVGSTGVGKAVMRVGHSLQRAKTQPVHSSRPGGWEPLVTLHAEAGLKHAHLSLERPLSLADCVSRRQLYP